MIYCFDIDGTLCTNTNGEYERVEPYPEVIALVNALYDLGHRIVLYTARGSTTGIDWRELTENQLHSWGVKYNELFLGKPHADLFIDDKAINPRSWEATLPIAKLASSIRGQSAREHSMLTKSEYLDVTYLPERVPYGRYPYLLAEWLLKNIYKKAGRLLDLGCGRGEYLEVFTQLGFNVAGVDISPRAPKLGNGHCVEVADLENDPLPFTANSFDFVFSKSVIEHARHPMCLLSKALESLRPGGTAVIMTPSWVHTYWGPFYIDHTHVTPFTAPSLSDALIMAGFDSVKVLYFYQLPFLWHYPFFKPIIWILAVLPLPYRPHKYAPWPDGLNKLIRFSKEVMLMGVGKKPVR